MGWQRAAFHEAGHFRRSVAPLRAPVKFVTLPVQLSVLANDRTLPIYGSSELYCCGDPYRPTQLFASQPTGFDVFAFGRYGIGNLLYAETFGALGHALEGQKLLVIDSPPWSSTASDADERSYALNSSPEIAKTLIFSSPISLPLREAIARRMLDLPATLAGDPVLGAAVRALADPTPLHLAAYRALVPLGQLEAWVERVRGARLVRHFLHNLPSPQPPQPALRRRRFDWPALAARGTKIADRRDSTNPFGFPNETYTRLLKKGEIVGALSLYQAGSTNREGQSYPPPTA